MITLTKEQRDVLVHVVIDADEWLAGAIGVARDAILKEGGTPTAELVEELAQSWLIAKVARWRPAYEAAKAAEGANYRNRKERDLAELRAMRDNPKIEERVRQELLPRLISDLENNVKPVRLSELRRQREATSAAPARTGSRS